MSARTPEAGSYIFPSLPKLVVSHADFVRILRLQAGVTVTPGTEYSPHSGNRPAAKFLAGHKAAVMLAVGNALTAVRGVLAGGEDIAAIFSMTVYVAAECDFTAHSRLADFASHHLHEELGERGIDARAAVGAATLPGNAPVEVQKVAAIT